MSLPGCVDLQPMLAVDIQGEEMWMLPERAIYWRRQKTLIVSDLHWGKTGHFRKNGIAVPLISQEKDEIILADLIRRHNIDRLIIAGDMFHSRQNLQTDNFLHWRDTHSSLAIELVSGNHDILDERVYALKKILVHPDVLDFDSFCISHDQLMGSTKFHIHGHIHPSFIASGKGRNAVKLPCFCLDEQRLVLPSFGRFTGNHNVSPAEYNHIYVVAGKEVIQWQ